jgi:hypothetical protein
MPREVVDKYLVYKFDELPEDAQEKALDWFRNSNMEHYDSDDMKSMFEEYLEERGLPNDTVEFSINHSQGDGVSFYGGMDKEDCEKFMEFYEYADRNRIAELDGITARIGPKHGSRHYGRGSIEIKRVELWDEPEELTDSDEDLINDFYSFLQDKIEEVASELETMGYKELEWITSDEYIKDQIEANDYEFTEDGKLA